MLALEALFASDLIQSEGKTTPLRHLPDWMEESESLPRLEIPLRLVFGVRPLLIRRFLSFDFLLRHVGFEGCPS